RDIAHARGRPFELLIESRDQRVVAFRGDRNQLADLLQFESQRLIGDANIALHRLDVALQIVANAPDVGAQIADEIEQRKIEIALPVPLRARGAVEQALKRSQQKSERRFTRTESPIVLPNVAPPLGSRRRSIDETVVTHGAPRISATRLVAPAARRLDRQRLAGA